MRSRGSRPEPIHAAQWFSGHSSGSWRPCGQKAPRDSNEAPGRHREAPGRLLSCPPQRHFRTHRGHPHIPL
eukprot:1346698-Pyramimonas_sp.AAC.1